MDNIDDELQFHLDEKIRDLMSQGLSREAATARAERELGDRSAIRQSVRTIVDTSGRQRERQRYWMGWREDVRYAVRGLIRSPQFSIPSIAIFALGVGLATAVFAVLHGIVLNPLPYPLGAELHQLYATNLKTTDDRSAMSPGDFFALRTALAGDVRIGGYMNWPVSLTGVAEPERLNGALATADLFTTLQVEPIEGRTFLIDEEQLERGDVAIISARLAARLGLSGRAPGSTIQLNGRPITVVGVMPGTFAFPEAATDVWIPLALRPADRDSHESRWLQTIARITPREAAAADARIQVTMAGLAAAFPQSNADWRARLVPLHRVVVAQARPTLIVLSLAIACVLLVMIVNLLTAVAARQRQRTAELSLQTALGAGLWRVTRQLGTEALMLAFFGGGIGLLFATGLVGAFRRLAPASLPRAAEVSLSMWPFLFAIAAGAIVVSIVTIIPVRAAHRRGGAIRLTGRGLAVGSSQPSRWPVVAQAALACLLIVSAGLLSQAFVRLSNIDLGFVPGNVLTLKISLPRGTPSERQTAYFSDVLERLRSVTAVTAVGAASDLPLAGNSLNVPIAIDGVVRDRSDPEVRAAFRVITPGYLEAIGAAVRGRAFEPPDGPAAEPVAIVNDALARQHWPDVNPIGQRLRTNEDQQWRTVVGVVRDVHHGGLTESEGPTIYVPHAQKAEEWMTWMSVAVRTAGDPLRHATAIRAAVAEADHNQPVSDVMTLQRRVDEALALPRLAAFIATTVAGITLLLAAAGLASTLSLFVSARTPEFSVRLALGAVPARLAWRTVSEAVRLVAAGSALGLAIAAAAGSVIASLLYDISAYDFATFAGAAAILLLTAVVTAIAPARAVARIDPSLTLRS